MNIRTADDDLIERLENAKEGSWDLSIAVIARVSSPWLRNAVIKELGSAGDEGHIIWNSPDAKPDPSKWYHAHVENVTVSLDAAVALIPKASLTGWMVADTPTGRAEARISLHEADNLFQARARTPALALCMACVMANALSPRS